MNTKDKKFRFGVYFKNHALAISIYLFSFVIGIGLDVFATIYTANLVVDITSGFYMLAIRKFVILLVGVAVLQNLNSLMRSIVYTKTSTKIIRAMSIDIAEQAFRISDKSYSEHNTANFTQRINQDPRTILHHISCYIAYISQIVTHIVILGYIFYINIYVGLIAIGGMGITMIIEYFRKRKYFRNRRELFKRAEKTSSLLNEIVRSEKDIKSLNLESNLKENIRKCAEDEANQTVKTELINSGIGHARNVFVNLISLGMMILSLIFMDKGLLTLATFMVIYSNRGSVSWTASLISEIVTTMSEMEMAIMRINELYEDEDYELEKFGNKRLKNIVGHIEFKNVGYSYTDYKFKDREEIRNELEYNKRHRIKAKIKTREEIGKNKVIEGMSFKIEPNTTVAFVGKSGSGKTTILNLISKMYEVDEGKVLIDGVDVKKLDKKTLRSAISLVNQFPYIFDMTIKENLKLAKPEATDEEINKAVKDAAIDEFIGTLPSGLDTKVGESGIKLSGGQKQRLAIARALLRRSNIIIFDESTSSLDNIAQNQIKRSIDNIKGKSTVVIVAHRLSTIKNVDKIFFLDQGKIIDSGTFEELFDRNEDFKTIFMAENI